MNRRQFVSITTTVGAGGLARCSVFGSDEVDDTIEMDVEKKWLRFEHRPASNPESYSAGWIVWISSDGAALHEDIVEETELTEDDVGPDTKLGELSIPEIYRAFQRIEYGSIRRTFITVEVSLQSRDEVSGHDPNEADPYHTYVAPTEFFDPIDLGESHRYRVAPSGEYYPALRSGRLIEILE